MHRSTVTIPSSILGRVEALAHDERRSRSNMVVVLIELGLTVRESQREEQLPSVSGGSEPKLMAT